MPIGNTTKKIKIVLLKNGNMMMIEK
ncbi:uncharacterized protein METZ01_LOCUS510898, partial [marine metagenome]